MDDRIKSLDETLQIINDFAKELANELEDFDLENTKVVYEVWALGYDANQKATDFEYFLDGDYTEVDEAKECFDYFASKDTLVAYLENKNLPIPADTKHLHLMLEECIDSGNGGTECQDIVEEVEIY